MWLPRQNRWTLIDFGCAARTGHPAPVAYSLYYAAPEVLTAGVSQQRSIVASEAHDAWAVGVLAIELFNGAPVFPIGTPARQVYCLLGWVCCDVMVFIHRSIGSVSASDYAVHPFSMIQRESAEARTVWCENRCAIAAMLLHMCF